MQILMGVRPVAASGLTLPELLVGMAIVAILALLSLPALAGLLLDARMSAEVNRLLHGLHLARQEAAKRGAEVVLCRSTDGRHCEHGPDWQLGWLIFVNHDRDQPPQVGAGEPVLLVAPAMSGLQVSANRQSFVLRPFGLRASNGTILLCDRRGTAHARTVIISVAGRPRTAPASAGSSRCAAG